MPHKFDAIYEPFGYDHNSKCTVDALKAACNDNSIAVPANAKKLVLLQAVEKYYAGQRKEAGTADESFLEPGFDAGSYSIAKLRQIMSYHDIDYPTTKLSHSDALNQFNESLDSIRAQYDGDEYEDGDEDEDEDGDVKMGGQSEDEDSDSDEDEDSDADEEDEDEEEEEEEEEEIARPVRKRKGGRGIQTPVATPKSKNSNKASQSKKSGKVGSATKLKAAEKPSTVKKTIKTKKPGKVSNTYNNTTTNNNTKHTTKSGKTKQPAAAEAPSRKKKGKVATASDNASRNRRSRSTEQLAEDFDAIINIGRSKAAPGGKKAPTRKQKAEMYKLIRLENAFDMTVVTATQRLRSGDIPAAILSLRQFADELELAVQDDDE